MKKKIVKSPEGSDSDIMAIVFMNDKDEVVDESEATKFIGREFKVDVDKGQAEFVGETFGNITPKKK